MGLKKASLMVGLLAMILLLSSEVTARDSKKAEIVEETNEVGDVKYGKFPGFGDYGGGDPGRGGYYGGGYPYGGGFGGGFPGRGGFGGGGGYCRYGCCGRAYLGGCTRCCPYFGEAMTAQTQDKTRN